VRKGFLATSLFPASISAATAAVPAHELISQKAAQPQAAALTTSGHGMASSKKAKPASHKFASVGPNGKKK